MNALVAKLEGFKQLRYVEAEDVRAMADDCIHEFQALSERDDRLKRQLGEAKVVASALDSELDRVMSVLERVKDKATAALNDSDAPEDTLVDILELIDTKIGATGSRVSSPP